MLPRCTVFSFELQVVLISAKTLDRDMSALLRLGNVYRDVLNGTKRLYVLINLEKSNFVEPRLRLSDENWEAHEAEAKAVHDEMLVRNMTRPRRPAEDPLQPRLLGSVVVISPFLHPPLARRAAQHLPPSAQVESARSPGLPAPYPRCRVR